MSWILTDFDPMTGTWLTAGFQMPRVIEPQTSKTADALLKKLQSLDVTQHSKTAKAVLNCFCKALDNMANSNCMHYGPLLAWAKMRSRSFVIIEGSYPFPADWEVGDWNNISKDLVMAMTKAAHNLGVGLDITVGSAEEVAEKSKTVRLSIKDQNRDNIQAMFGGLGLDTWRDPEGFRTFFNNDAAMMSGKLKIINDDGCFKHGVEVWMPRLGLKEDRPTLFRHQAAVAPTLRLMSWSVLAPLLACKITPSLAPNAFHCSLVISQTTCTCC